MNRNQFEKNQQNYRLTPMDFENAPTNNGNNVAAASTAHTNNITLYPPTRRSPTRPSPTRPLNSNNIVINPVTIKCLQTKNLKRKHNDEHLDGEEGGENPEEEESENNAMDLDKEQSPTSLATRNTTDSNFNNNEIPQHDKIKEVRMITNELKIIIEDDNPVVFQNCSRYNDLIFESFRWHQIVIFHNGKYQKDEIVKKLFDIVENAEFYPIAYRVTKDHDYFFIVTCRAALKKLFSHSLVLQMDDGGKIELMIKINVAKYKFGQMNPQAKLSKCFYERLHRLLNDYRNTKNVLNLNAIHESPLFQDIIINLGNTSAFTLFIDELCNVKQTLKHIQGILLTNNNLKIILPIALLKSKLCNLKFIDLSSNNIHDKDQLKCLKEFPVLTELYLAKNPVLKVENCTSTITKYIPKLQRMDNYEIIKSHFINTKVIFDEFQILNNGAGEWINGDDKNIIKEFRKYRLSDFWHQIVIHHNGEIEPADSVIDIILNSISLYDLFPCYYMSFKEYDVFYVRNCFEALEFLVSTNLQLKIPNKQQKLQLSMKMNVNGFKLNEHIDPNKKIMQTIVELYDAEEKILNLEHFNERIAMNKVIIKLSNPRMLALVLTIANRKLSMNGIYRIILAGNDIRSSRGLHAVSFMKNIQSIDFSKNSIASIADLKQFPLTKITDVQLYKNPLCKKYSSPFEYIKDVKTIFPEMKTIDNKTIGFANTLNNRNYFCSGKLGRDFINQFVPRFIEEYDSKDRNNMKEMYHPNAMLTISMNLNILAATTINQTPLNVYQQHSRNILDKNNKNNDVSVIIGQDNIINLWNRCGPTKHDRFCLNIVLLHHMKDTYVFSIAGIFKIIGKTADSPSVLVGYTRNFVIKIHQKNLGLFGNSMEYRIMNEQLLIYQPSLEQELYGFPVPNEYKPSLVNNSNLTDYDKLGLQLILQKITALKLSYCRKYLIDSSWNLKQAMLLFNHHSGVKTIPQKAFLSSKTLVS